ncbi:transposase [Skermanella rosea]|uniref:transposase n=1 Tax=Skermanella rosea TaxID=1817965 RepID=UPI00389A74BE
MPHKYNADEAVAAWRAAPRITPGGQARYSDLAIETSLILRAVFHQPAAPAPGTGRLPARAYGAGPAGAGSLDPDHSTLSRRARTLAVALQPRAANEPVHLLVHSTGV